MALLKVSTGVSTTGVQHTITAGNDFDGTLPTVDALTAPVTYWNSMNKFTADASGGLIDFEQTEPIWLEQYALILGAVPVAYTISLVSYDSTGTEITAETLLIEDSTASQVVSNSTYLLGTNQKIRLVTAGAAGVMVARFYARSARFFQR